MSEKFRKEHRQHAIHKLGNLFAGTKLTTIPIDMLVYLLNMPENDLSSLASAIRTARSHHIEFNAQDVKEAIDVSHVVEVMEPDPDPEDGPVDEAVDLDTVDAPEWKKVDDGAKSYLESLAMVRSPELMKAQRELFDSLVQVPMSKRKRGSSKQASRSEHGDEPDTWQSGDSPGQAATDLNGDESGLGEVQEG